MIQLQEKVRALEAEVAQLSQGLYEPPDVELMMRSAGYVRFKEQDEPRYLGPSSGITITRLVMELAKQNTDSKSIKEIVPETKAQRIKDRFSQEEKKHTSKIYPLISDVAAPHLPSRDLTDSLVDIFNRKAQYMLPTLHEPSFRDVVEDVYRGSKDAYQNFTLRMVIAISMQKLDTCYAGLADSYYLAALPFLEQAVRPMDLGTLQCFILMAQYSLVTPTRTAAYWVVGFATRLCQELGITEEAAIAPVNNYKPQYNPLQIDMRRRLFWIVTSMEFGLAHSLGRPSAFGTTFDHIDVGFFEIVDDQFITPSGIVPGSPPSMKKRIAIHFFKMRLLQAEIRRKLYLKRRPEPRNDQDPWFLAMEAKIKDWHSSCPKNDEGSGLSETWFKGRYNTITIFLHRPSPQLPEPSVNAARECYDAAVFNIQMQREQITSRSVDLTWIFTQSLFMALNTALWALSYPDIRKEHPRSEVQNYVHMAQEGIYLASERWPGVESAIELYDSLVSACLRTYDNNSETPYVMSSPSFKTSPASSQEINTPPPLHNPFTNVQPRPYGQVGLKVPGLSPNSYPTETGTKQGPGTSPNTTEYDLSDPSVSHSVPSVASLDDDFRPIYQDVPFDPASVYNTFPSMLPAFQPNITHDLDNGSYLVSIGEQYSQYLHAPYVPQQPFQALSQVQQMELMNSLESNGLKAY